MLKNDLIRKVRLIFKLMTSQSGYKKIAIQILSNISRTKGRQAIKFRQSIEKNTRNIFLGKSYTNCGAETVPRTFARKTKFRISLEHEAKVLNSLFLLHVKLKTIEMY